MAGLLQGGLAAFFQEYAVLARLLAVITDRWVEATVEVLQRLDADWPLLQQHVGGADALGRVSAVRSSLSDPHRDRRRVMALTFASARRDAWVFQGTAGIGYSFLRLAYPDRLPSVLLWN